MGLELNTDVQFIKGVGPKLGGILKSRGAGTVKELLEWFPRTYEDRRAARSISSLEANQVVSFVAHVVAVRSQPLGRTHRKIYDIVVADATGRVSCKYFRVPYKGYFERFEPHQKVRVSGKVSHYRGRIEMHHPDLNIIGDVGEDETDALIPLYTETEGVSPAKLRKIIDIALREAVAPKPALVETLPAWIREKFKLIDRSRALQEIHQPNLEFGSTYLEYRSPAQRRIIFEEFFWLELIMASRRAGYRKEVALELKADPKEIDSFLKTLPFSLTGAQSRVLNEVAEDLKKTSPMHRLVQGDVGSGKTMVAFIAALIAAKSGAQAALMVPTEILAEQHYKNAVKFLSASNLKVALLTGHMTEKEQLAVSEQIKNGEVDLCIGTHALIEDYVEFKKLGLVIVDEQHRFGVEQRMRLKKGTSPHFLIMTATPIPRTLAMTVYGDLDVSIIDELPPGRSPIVTKKVFPAKRATVLKFMLEQVQKGRQAYIIYPLVEESEKIDLKDAVSEFEKLKSEYPQVAFGLLHGRMRADEKEVVMEEFRKGQIQVLVSTTVIEVGVDVPNANMMIIEHAERFGLSQLHQLRGRVGRGAHKSYCVLIVDYAVSDDGLKRAEVIESSTDGFKIAEADLELRGPGEFLGRRQSGLPGFKMANLVRDLPILKDARNAAFELLQIDPELTKKEHLGIRALYHALIQQSVG
jgi:ATP-dependent DNA helicase RecG